MTSDFKNIQKLFRLGNILGVTPAWGARSPGTLYKSYILILTFLSVFGTALSLNKRYVALSELNMNLAQAFLESSECLSELSFMLACFLGVTRKMDNWRTLVYNLSNAEEKLHSLDFRRERSICYYVVRVCLFHAVFIGMHAYELTVFLEVEQTTVEYGYILYRIIMYYQFFTTYTVVCLNEILKERYMFLDGLVEEILRAKSKIVIISLKEDQRILLKLHKIQRIYTSLYTTVRQINCIFGWTKFFIFSTYVLILLGNLNYVLKYTQTEDSGYNVLVFFNYALYSTIYTISTIAIVMSCDGVERSGKKIVKTCFLYQEVLEKPALKDDLVLFAKFLKQLAPTFSAAGFFQINQSVLSALFSAVITYLIIILQFNMTL